MWENAKIIIPDRRESREAEISAGPASLRDRSVEGSLETADASDRRARDTEDLDEVQEDAHAYLTNIDSGEGEREVSRRRFTVTERVFFSLSSHPRPTLLLSPGFLFLVVATAFGKLTGSRSLLDRQRGMSTAGVRSVVPAEPRCIDRSPPSESVNESEADERAGDPRDRRRDAARRAELSRDRDLARGRAACVRAYVRACARGALDDDVDMTTARTRTAN